MYEILVIRLYFPLHALHVSDCISPPSEATFISCTSRLVATQQPDGIYQMRCTAYKVAPDDGLIQSETCRASNRKWSLITRILCTLLVHIHIIKRMLKSTGIVTKTQVYPLVTGHQFRHSCTISHNAFSVFNAATFHVDPTTPPQDPTAQPSLQKLNPTFTTWRAQNTWHYYNSYEDSFRAKQLIFTEFAS